MIEILVALLAGIIIGLLLGWQYLKNSFATELAEVVEEFEQKLKAAQKELAEAESDHREIVEKLVSLQWQYQSLQKKHDDLTAERDAFQAALDKIERDHRSELRPAEPAASHEQLKELEDYKRRALQAEAQVEELLGKVESTQAAMQIMQEEMSGLKENNKESDAELLRLRSNIKEESLIKEERIRELEEELDKARRSSQLEKHRRHELLTEFERIQDQLMRMAGQPNYDEMRLQSFSLHEDTTPFESANFMQPLIGEAVVKKSGGDYIETAPAIEEINTESPYQPKPKNGDDQEPEALFEKVHKPSLNDDTPEFDDLQQIKGIGPVIETKLHKLGIKTIKQIAVLSPEDCERIDQTLNFKGRIYRERWIDQAKEIMNTI